MEGQRVEKEGAANVIFMRRVLNIVFYNLTYIHLSMTYKIYYVIHEIPIV